MNPIVRVGLAAILGHYCARFIRHTTLPLGPPKLQPAEERPVIPHVDFSNTELTFKSAYVVCLMFIVLYLMV